MPQITENNQEATITFTGEDFVSGLSTNGTFGQTNIFPQMSKYGASNLQNINPFITYGVLSPGYGSTNVTNNSVLSGVVVSGVVQGSTNAFLVDAGGKFHKYDYTSQQIINSGNFPHTIVGTTPVGQDVIVYKHNVGGTAPANQIYGVFFSYITATTWNVGVSNSPFSAIIDPYMSVTPANPLGSGDYNDPAQIIAPHPMEVGSDDVLYIGSGRYIHAYDGSVGADGTFYSQVLSLPVGFTIVGLKKYQDVMLIAGNYNTDTTNSIGGEALLYTWNYIDLDITEAIDLEDPTVVSLFLWKGIPHVMTVGEKEGRGTNKLKAIVGNNVTLRSTFNLTAPINRGVDASSNVLYVNCGGKIIQIGDPYNLNSSQLPVNQIGQMPNASLGISGWVKNLGVEPSNLTNYGLIGASSTTSSGGTNSLATFITSIGQNWNTNATYLTPFFDVPKPPGKAVRLKNIIMENYNTYTLADFTFQFLYDYGSTGFAPIFTSNAALIVPLTKQYKYDVSGNPLQRCTNIAFELLWNSNATVTATPPRITKIILVFEFLDLLSNNPT